MLLSPQLILRRRKPIVAGAWVTSAQASGALNVESSGWNTYTLVVLIPAAVISNTGGSQVRVTFNGGMTEGTKIANAYIQMKAAAGDPYDFSATPVQLLFSGSASMTVGIGATTVSDPAAFSIAAATDLLIAVYFDDGANDNFPSKLETGWNYYYKNANEAATVNRSAYSGLSDAAAFVSKIESFL